MMIERWGLGNREVIVLHVLAALLLRAVRVRKSSGR